MGLSMMALLVLVVGVALIPATIVLASDIIKVSKVWFPIPHMYLFVSSMQNIPQVTTSMH